MALSLLLCAATPACGGGPGSGKLQDNASAELAVVANGAGDAGAAPDGSGPTAPVPSNVECMTPEQGCPCATPDESISCHAPIIRDGDYVTCEGTRVCSNGTWGPCWPPIFSPAGRRR